ncbi:MAG: cation-translocating P-type ATPase [Moorellales bacterium]
MQPETWYRLRPAEVLAAFGTRPGFGLTEQQARQRNRIFGPNRLPGGKRVSPVRLLLNQFANFMVIVLLVAVLISALAGEVVDACTVLAIVLINAVLGFIQEYRAERSLEALREMSAPQATVLRGGRVQRVAAAEVVPGDILLLEAGDRVAADARILESSALEVDESLLTGESVPVAKTPATLEGEVPLAERFNMVFQGTVITRGRGSAVVVATGKRSELGQVAELLQSAVETDTPLQKRMGELGRWLVLACLGLCLGVVLVGIYRGIGLYTMLMAGVSLAVAAIPEGLPAVVTVCLALGVQRMLRRRAIVRRLPAVETLGCTTVICSDKTGTLTANQMTVREVFVGDRRYEVTGEGYSEEGEFLSAGRKTVRPDPDLERLLTAVVCCNNSRRQRRRGRWEIIGDPTEAALLTAAAKAGIRTEDVEGKSIRVAELPFASERRRMTVVCREGGRRLVAYVKGATEAVLPLCRHYQNHGRLEPLGEERIREVLDTERRMASQGLRVLAVAFRYLPEERAVSDPERDLVFLGLVGMLDPPRPAVRRALELCRQAGIRVIMVTGDHRETAWAVARELGIAEKEEQVVTGAELDRLADVEVVAGLKHWRVLARVSPQHKLRLVRLLRAQGEIVAVTGDGVNDAPAIKEADIGVAMGGSGTEVAKEAAAMVLVDDNFATLVAAVEEGRAIYSNLRKFVRYLLSCNLGEVLTMWGALLLGLPLPLVPLQILWMNLLTDGLPALALSLEPASPSLMQRPPRTPGESLFAGGLGKSIILGGAEIALVTLGAFVFSLWAGGGNLEQARAVAFSTLVFCQLAYVFVCRWEPGSDLPELHSNSWLLAAVAVSAIMQFLVVQWRPLGGVFHTAPLAVEQWLIVVLAGMLLMGRYRWVRGGDRSQVPA